MKDEYPNLWKRGLIQPRVRARDGHQCEQCGMEFHPGTKNGDDMQKKNLEQYIEITRAPIRYFGGKWRIAPWIIQQFPQHTTYVEPFCGGASVLFRKQPSKIEVINDLSHQVANFFEVLRNEPDLLVRAIDLTPYSRSEYELSWERPEGLSPLEAARRFYVRTRQSLGSSESSHRSGWRHQVNDKPGTNCVEEWSTLDHLYATAKRLKNVQIDCGDGLKVIERFDSPDTLFYVDPPYVLSTRHKSNGYQHEMTDSQHEALAESLQAIRGMAIISGYPCTLYDELYSQWRCIRRATKTNFNNPSVECLWISPEADKAGLPLFKLGGVK